MRSKLSCKPPIRLDMVSWKPSEMAMPPMPSAVTAALTSTLKLVDSMMQMPSAHTAPRPMFTKMELEGRFFSSLKCSMRRRKCVIRRAATAVMPRMTTTDTAVLSQSDLARLSSCCSS